MGTRPTLFSNRANFSKIPVKIKQQQHASFREIALDRYPDVPISNVCCQIPLCKYLDAYVNATTAVSFPQLNRAQDFLDAAEQNARASAAFGWKVRGRDLLWRPRHLLAARAYECPPQQARKKLI